MKSVGQVHQSSNWMNPILPVCMKQLSSVIMKFWVMPLQSLEKEV